MCSPSARLDDTSVSFATLVTTNTSAGTCAALCRLSLHLPAEAMPKDTRDDCRGTEQTGRGREEGRGLGGGDDSPTILQQYFEEAARDEDHRTRRC